MNMDNYIQLEKSNCKNCYKCIRNCPIKAIKITNNKAHIVQDECILCGNCFVTCPQNAKQIRNDINIVKRWIKEGKKVYASVAPSFIVNYEGHSITSLRHSLKALGFEDADETSIGATIVKKQYEKLLKEGNKKLLISSCCHTVNSLIQKYHPKVLPYLADVISPMQAHCQLIKSQHEDAKTVFIGPCISKKEEATLYPEYVDCVLTFEELTNWFSEEQLVLTEQEEDYIGGKTRLFPTAGGIIKSMDTEEIPTNYVVIDGIDNCIQTLKDIETGNISECFIEMSACTNSCTHGPSIAKHMRKPISNYLLVTNYAGTDDFCVALPKNELLKKEHHYINCNKLMPGSTAIAEILHQMGKHSPEQELNCGSCGYDTCREKAIAVYHGKADLNMCLPYLKEKAESFSDNIIYNTPNGIIVLNENLEVQQINKAALHIFNLTSKRDILGSPVVRILNPAAYINVMTTGKNIMDKRNYLAEYKKYVQETIIYDEMYHIIISIMRDITEDEKVRIKKDSISKQTIEITDKVVEKQMRVVQEIASLLGETAAETKIALTNLKETLENE